MSRKTIAAVVMGTAWATLGFALIVYVAAQTSLSLILTGEGLWFTVAR